MNHARSLATAVLVAVFAAACGGGEPVPAAPSPDPSPAPPATDAAGTPSPTPSPTPAGSPAPLTGEALTDPAAADRPALVVKVENSAAARPQSGLEVADVVYEEIVEGGVTRFIAIFHSQLPEHVGPIRSARLVDAGVAPAYRGVFVYSGARAEVEAALRGSGMAMLTDGAPGTYRDRSRRAPHNLYAEGPPLAAAAAELDGTAAPAVPWRFAEAAPPGGSDGRELSVAMTPQATTGWTYDPAAGVYRRSQDGAPFTVTGAGEVGAANVVVLATEVGAAGCCDSAGSPYVETRTVGEGRAVVLRDGRRYEATWRKAADDAHLELVTAGGTPFPLKPGPTWLQLAPAERVPEA